MFVLGAPQRMDVSYMEIVPTDQSYGGSQFHRRGADVTARRLQDRGRWASRSP